MKYQEWDGLETARARLRALIGRIPLDARSRAPAVSRAWPLAFERDGGVRALA